MKSLGIYILSIGALSLAFFGCKKDEDVSGCTNPVATNFNVSATSDDGSCQFKPTISIIQPTAEYEPKDNNVSLELSFEDGQELVSAAITLQSAAFSGGAYFAQERGLNGTTDKVIISAELPKINMLGNHFLVVKARNMHGKEEVASLDFKLADNTKPVVKLNRFYSDLDMNPGTPHTKFDYEVSENYGLKSILKEVMKTDASGTELDNLFLSTKKFSELSLTLSDTAATKDSPVSSSPGTYYRGKLTVTDLAGNETIVLSEVRQFQ